MSFHFNPEKTTQAAALFLLKRDGKMDVLSLMKLLYFADKAALVSSGAPITRDRYVSMPHGMVLSATYTLVTKETFPISYWRQFISPVHDHEVSLLFEPMVVDLSSQEIKIIHDVYAKYGHLNRWELRDLHHDLPEWKDPNGSSIPISHFEVLLAAGVPEDDATEMLADLMEITRFEQFFEC